MEEHSKKVLELGGKIVVLTIENSMFGLVGTSMLDPDGNHLGMLEYMQKP
jgi:predicted lactoylglutathione lyase